MGISELEAKLSKLSAAAYQNNEFGILIGNQTFGKGIVQTIYKLSDGSDLKLTTSTYYTPKKYVFMVWD